MCCCFSLWNILNRASAAHFHLPFEIYSSIVYSSSIYYTSPRSLEIISLIALAHLGSSRYLSVSCTRKGTCLFPIGASGLEDLSECVCWINKRWEYPDVSHSNLSLTCWWALVASSNLPLPLPQLTPTFHSIVQVSFGAHRPAAFDPLTILCLSREPPTRYSKKHHTFLSKKTAFSSLIKG